MVVYILILFGLFFTSFYLIFSSINKRNKKLKKKFNDIVQGIDSTNTVGSIRLKIAKLVDLKKDLPSQQHWLHKEIDKKIAYFKGLIETKLLYS